MTPTGAADLARRFFGELEELSAGCLQGRCPGEHAHTHKSSGRDLRVFLSNDRGKAPGAYCFHSSCLGVLDPLNRDFRSELGRLERGGKPSGKPPQAGVAAKPAPAKGPSLPEYDEAVLRRVVAPAGPVDVDWIMERSPVDPRNIRPGQFLEAVFQPGEKAMVFLTQFSQGDFLWWVGKGGFRLGDRGVQAVRSEIPTDGGRDGIWYLSQPVDGQWHANPRNGGKYSRRSEEAVTAWRHVVLESDKAPSELWLPFLAICGLKIAAVYSSGGRSWHALVRLDATTKADWDMEASGLKKNLSLLGADPGAISGVRLTRLPSCTRGGRLQRLIWLDPSPVLGRRMIDLIPRRKISHNEHTEHVGANIEEGRCADQSS